MASAPGSKTPPALVASIAFGVAGLVLIVVGLASGSQAVLVGGVGAGTVSLVAALVWREQLIEAFHARQRQPDD